jgi:hypothetical protein
MGKTIGHARGNGADLIGPETLLMVYEARDPAHAFAF